MIKRKQYITILSIIASFGVVMLHTNDIFWAFSYGRKWVFANIIESVMYFSAPIFFMITGATLINYRKKYDTVTFFKKRLSKIALPFVFWSTAYFVFQCIIGNRSFEEFTLISFFNSIFNVQYISIYWFFISLISIYLTIPVLSAISEEKRRSVFKYLIIASFILNALLPLLFNLTNGKLQYNYALNMPFGLNNVILPIMGYYISEYEMSKKTKALIYLSGAIGVALIFFGTLVYSYRAGHYVAIFKDYANAPCLCYSAAIFLLFKSIPFEKFPDFFNKIVAFFAPTTFGIYLLHMFVIDTIRKYLPMNEFELIYRTLGPLVIYIICVFISRIIQAIPFVRKLIP